MKKRTFVMIGATALVAAGCAASADQGSAPAISAPSAVQGEARPGHGHGRMNARKGMMLAMFERADFNADGVLTTDEARTAAAAHFAQLDTDGDGKLTREERRAGKQAARAEMKSQRFAMLDTNGDGALSLEEVSARAGDRAQRRFAKLDANGDGMVTQDEMAQMRKGRGKHGAEGRGGRMGKMRHGGRGSKGATLASAEARALMLFDRADANSDGVVTREEAQSMRGHHRGFHRKS